MNREQAQRFYDTLAMLIGQREGVEITVKVSGICGSIYRTNAKRTYRNI